MYDAGFDADDTQRQQYFSNNKGFHGFGDDARARHDRHGPTITMSQIWEFATDDD